MPAILPGRYRITNVLSKLPVTLQSAKPVNGTFINQNISVTLDKDDTQVWDLRSLSNGEWRIVNAKAGIFATAINNLQQTEDPSTNLLARIFSRPALEADDRFSKWTIEKYENGESFVIRSTAYPGKVWDDNNRGTEDGTAILVWTPNGGGGDLLPGPHQRWTFTPV
ncbi:hypothetical protein G7Y89_g7380 [Cudoniella acicularis]|uniref:Ricin B lectin domain-containing protein n=1 Tax=Cudoniella acicularis TaxID=354080 RepID=A0A8H4RL14_9HELO|nr:hypothetical protein G7Y89_g7380 [Cudoniella acicularis]